MTVSTEVAPVTDAKAAATPRAAGKPKSIATSRVKPKVVRAKAPTVKAPKALKVKAAPKVQKAAKSLKAALVQRSKSLVMPVPKARSKRPAKVAPAPVPTAGSEPRIGRFTRAQLEAMRGRRGRKPAEFFQLFPSAVPAAPAPAAKRTAQKRSPRVAAKPTVKASQQPTPPKPQSVVAKPVPASITILEALDLVGDALAVQAHQADAAKRKVIALILAS